MKASVLAIGTEITSGQIVNRNPSWVSHHLEQLGIEVVLHMTVADEWKEMKWALDQCAAKSDFIFVTGGLGPTSDDFTRDVVAEWSGEILFFHEPSLKKIEETMARLKRNFVETQKRQCYYPKGSEVLENRAGTANGFTLQVRGKRLWILPGPPREVAAIWNDFIDPYLRRLTPTENRMQLFSWHCLGKPEAELAEIVENAVKGSQLKTGYRLHAPYVEVKIWCQESQIQEQSLWIRKVEDVVKPWLFLHDGEDLAERFLDQVRSVNKHVRVVDHGTSGYLIERLAPLIRESGKETHLSFETAFSSVSERADDKSVSLEISPLENDRQWKTWFRFNGAEKCEVFESSVPPTPFNEKNRLMVVELTLKAWIQWLRELDSQAKNMKSI